MARPRRELQSAADILALADAAGRIALRVTPGARAESIEIADGCLLVRIKEKPESGKANDAVLRLLAEALHCAPSQLELLRGQKSRLKLVGLTRLN